MDEDEDFYEWSHYYEKEGGKLWKELNIQSYLAYMM